MIKGEHTYIGTLCTCVFYECTFVRDKPYTPCHFDVRGDKKARINRAKVGSPA